MDIFCIRATQKFVVNILADAGIRHWREKQIAGGADLRGSRVRGRAKSGGKARKLAMFNQVGGIFGK